MTGTLAERFQASGGAPVEWGNQLVHMYEVLELRASTAMRIEFLELSPARPQALRLKTRGGRLELNGQLLDDIVLWSDSAPEVVVATAHPDKSGKPMSVRVWNAWRDAEGTMQAWIGNAGMLIEGDSNTGLVLRCSDGFDEPTFSDLVAKLALASVAH